MQPGEFERETARLRNHFGERHYSNELVAILWEEFKTLPDLAFRKIVLEAVATFSQGRPPLRDDFKRIASELNFEHRRADSWKYLEAQDCLWCGGCGWHYVQRSDGAETVCACDDCRAGKNLQGGPKGTITWTMKQCKGATYSRPGRGGQHEEEHPKLRAFLEARKAKQNSTPDESQKETP